MLRIITRVLALGAILSLGFATTGWAGDDAAAEKKEPAVDAAPPAEQADADAGKTESTEAEKQDDQAATD